MNGSIMRAAGLGLLALAAQSCVSRAQYDRLVTEYHSENQARIRAEEELASLEGELDSSRQRAMSAEQRAANTGRESDSRIRQLQAALEDAQSRLRSPLGQDMEGVTVLPTDDGFRILVEDELLFDSGSTEIKTKGKAALNSIAKEILAKNYGKVRIDGHTDNDPIVKTKEKFPRGNMELAAERALSVYDYLVKRADVPTNSIHLAAFGPNLPRVKGSTPDAKQKNRRVEIQVAVDPRG